MYCLLFALFRGEYAKHGIVKQQGWDWQAP